MLTPLILLLFGIMQLSIAYNRTQGLHAAAREGARVASLPQTTRSQVVDRVETALDGVIPDSSMGEVSISVDPSSSQPCDLRTGERVRVTVAFPNDIDIPLWPPSPATVTLTGRGEFRCE